MRHLNDPVKVSVNVMMRRPTLAGLPAVPTLPAPLIVRRALAADVGALTTLIGRAFPNERWEEAETLTEIFGDESVKTTLVIADGERLLATASLQVPAVQPTCGWIRWVATDQNHRRQGLARTLVISVLDNAKRLVCDEVRLRTHTYPLEAIPLYLHLGFEPFVTSDSDRDVWKRVQEQLRHP